MSPDRPTQQEINLADTFIRDAGLDPQNDTHQVAFARTLYVMDCIRKHSKVEPYDGENPNEVNSSVKILLNRLRKPQNPQSTNQP